MLPRDDEETTFLLLLGRLERLNQGLVSEVCGRHDISPSEIRVLAMLREAGPSGVRPATLGRWVLQTAGGLTATLKRLDANGYTVATADPEDGRSKRIGLTKAGTTFHDTVLGELSDRYRLALNSVDLGPARAQVEVLIAALERFGNHPPSAGWSTTSDPAPATASTETETETETASRSIR